MPVPCNQIDSVNTTLLKHGLNAAGRAYLAARPNIRAIPNHGIYECSPTRSLVLNAWEGDITVGTLTEKVVFKEQPQALVLDGTVYKLITRVQVGPNEVNYEGVWTYGGGGLPLIDDANNIFNDANNNICWLTKDVLNEVVPWIAPPPEPDPEPFPEFGWTVEIHRRGAGVKKGTVTVTANTDGTFYLTASVTWKHPVEGPCSCIFAFTPPAPIQGMTSGLIDVTGPPEPVGAMLTPSPDPTISKIETGPFTAALNQMFTIVFTATLEANP